MTTAMTDDGFRTRDLFDTWRAGGHNPRTRSAFDCGVVCRTTGRPLVYMRSPTDYADAEVAGWEAADRLMRDGRLWVCGECDRRRGYDPAEEHCPSCRRLFEGADATHGCTECGAMVCTDCKVDDDWQPAPCSGTCKACRMDRPRLS